MVGMSVQAVFKDWALHCITTICIYERQRVLSHKCFKWLDGQVSQPEAACPNPTIKHLYRAKREEIKYFTHERSELLLFYFIHSYLERSCKRSELIFSIK